MPDTSSSTALDGLLLATTSDGMDNDVVKPVPRRVKDAKAAYEIYRQLREGDREGALNRVRYQMKLDGGLPYSKSEQAKYGMADNANVNFGFMEDAVTASAAPYEDLVDGSENLARLPTRYGFDASQRQEWESVMEEEFTSLIVDDEGFDYRLAELTRQFNLHGIAVPFFMDDLGITWNTTETGNFLLPRHIRASEDSVEVACCAWHYLPHQLYHSIEDAPKGEKEWMGWNLKQTWTAMKGASTTDQGDDWERYQEQWKNNDLGLSYSGQSKTVHCVVMWVREMDGRVTSLIFQADGTGEDFIYESRGRYAALSEAFTIFTDGVGTNGKFHGIRGIGSKLYAVVKEMDEIWSGFLDAIRASMKQIVQPKNEAAMKNLQKGLVQTGPYMVIPPGSEYIPHTAQNFAQNAIPGLNMLTQVLQGKNGQYTTQAAFDQTKEQTRTEILARLDQVAKLSLTKVKIFYKSWTRLLREQVRRVIRKDWTETDPDYRRVKEFYKRCEERGVPREAIHAIDLKRVRAVRAAGNGSAEARSAMYERLTPMSSQYDAEGQHKFRRGFTIAIGGKEMADSLEPKKPGQRPPQDKFDANVENSLFNINAPVAPPEPNQIHSVHVGEHLTGSGGLLELVQAFRSQQIGYESIPIMRQIHIHCDGDQQRGIIGHMQFIPESGSDGRPNMERAGFKEALEQCDGVIWNGEKHLEAERQKQMEQQAEQQPQQEQLGATVGRQAEQAETALLKVQSDAAAKEAATAQELQHKQLAFDAEEARKQAAFDREQARQTARTDAEIAAAILTKTQGRP